jgi:hypothetical protein
MCQPTDNSQFIEISNIDLWGNRYAHWLEQQLGFCVANLRDATANRVVDRVVKQLVKSQFDGMIE